MSRQHREKASQKSGQHIPEEVLHGSILLSEDAPTSYGYQKAARSAMRGRQATDQRKAPGFGRGLFLFFPLS